MTIWIVLGLMTLAASAIIALPLLGRHPDGKHHLVGPLALAIGMPLISFALYLLAGSPNLPGSAGPVTDDRLTRLAAEVKARPEDAHRWAALAQAELETRRYREAKQAWDQAAALAPTDLAIQLDYANYLLSLYTGPGLPPHFSDVVGRIAALSPDHPLTLFYSGLIAKEDGQPDRARDLWNTLLARLPADAPLRTVLQSEIQSLGK
ncbi:MAG TPA: hypothetical protein VHL08_01155 [Dongiaceae bacterium]|jgi:cytochrome c-type biogenesis protein CcmH|nr:hypothetical protein [Dongiaceae bacterium]